MALSSKDVWPYTDTHTEQFISVIDLMSSMQGNSKVYACVTTVVSWDLDLSSSNLLYLSH
jgi:hypothetical protein